MSASGGAAALVPPVPDVVTMTFERIGWEIRSVDIDLSTGKAVARLFRFDGRWLYLSADASGRAVIERWQREKVVECGSPSIRDRFLGRTSCAGARSALRSLCDYVAENPAPGLDALPVGSVRDAVRLLMSAEGQS